MTEEPAELLSMRGSMRDFRPLVALRFLFVWLLVVAAWMPAGPGVPAVGARTAAPVGALAPVAEVRLDALPPEARQTLALIRAGGPYPYSRDGVSFGNREGLLPPQPRGWYSEFTVPTPGARDRGARRIVAGGRPGQWVEFWYTADHYQSFQRIRESP